MRYGPFFIGLALGFAAIGLHAAPLGAACPPPSDYPNQVSVQEGDVLVSFASDQQVYLAGQPVRFYLSFENTGSTSLHFPCPYSPEYKIWILPDSCLSVDQPGCDTLAAVLPGFVFWFSPGVFLDPGECHVMTAIWDDGYYSFPPEPGNYRAFGGLPSTTTGEEFSVPSGGAELSLTVGAISSIRDENPFHITWGRIKALYP